MADFGIALLGLLKNEGGLSNNLNDHGGLTKYGISSRSYPNVDIAALTLDKAAAIYREDFWMFDGIVDQSVANKVLDAYVNMGRTAIKILQRVVGTEPDGHYGVLTEKAVNVMYPGVLLGRFRTALVDHYEAVVAADPTQAGFLLGWLRRARK